MAKKEKVLAKLCANPSPKDFRWDDFLTLMSRYGFASSCDGGSHYMFEHTNGFRFGMSKTHPSGILKSYQVKEAKRVLISVGVIYE